MRCKTLIKLLTMLLAAATLVLSAPTADARIDGSAISRGLRRLLPAPLTRTPPRPSKSPMQQTVQPGHPGATTTKKVTHRPGLIGGLVAGFLGAGVLGLLFGNGFFAGLGGLASLVGLILQIALFVFIGWLGWGWWQRRASPAFAGLSPRQLADVYDRPRSDQTAGMAAAGKVRLTQDDYDAFERLLGEIHTAYGREDIPALRARMTPDMLSKFRDDLAKHAGRGLINHVSNVKLLQGDLIEAWREDERDYATVAMRFSLIDRMIERATERVVEGGSDLVTEMWTFVRAADGAWLLSEIHEP
jgi:predicted lipid-binding transport protein (Tim44 family)